MKNKTLVSLFLTLSLTLATSLVGTIFVQADELSADKLYNKAYNSAEMDLSTGKQVDINTGTNATETTMILANFPELSYVPQSTGVEYDKKVVSGNTIMYEYSVLNVPLDFMNTYKNKLSKNGWGICSTTYVDADFKIPYYSYFNNGYEVSISKSTSDF
ncbi:MAG: hypothetical protein ACI8WT_000563, partial [Clostridium sp.]